MVRQFGVPSGWRAVQLGSLAKIVGGGTPSREEGTFWSGGKIPWATPTDLTANPGKYIRRTAERITQAGLAESGAVLLPINTVLFTSRATIGECAIAKCEMATNQGFANFIPLNNTNSGFLYYLLHHLTSIIKRLSAGTTFSEVSKREIREVWCAVPDAPEEQAAIARILGVVDTAIECTQDAIERAWDLKIALLQRFFFGALGETAYADRPRRQLPEGWRLLPTEATLIRDPKNGVSPSTNSQLPRACCRMHAVLANVEIHSSIPLHIEMNF